MDTYFAEVRDLMYWPERVNAYVNIYLLNMNGLYRR